MSRLSLLLLCSAALGLAPACAMKRAADASASPEASYGGSGGMAAAEAPPSPSPDYGGDGESMKKSMDYDAAPSDESYNRSEPTSVTAAPARGPAGGVAGGPPSSLPEPKPKPVEAREGEPKPDDTDPKKQFARQIIYTAELQLSVYKLDDAMARAEALTLAAGGYVQNLSRATTSCGSPPRPCAASWTSSPTSASSRPAPSKPATSPRSTSTSPPASASSARPRQQLLVLLKQARNVDEALKVRESVDRITMELEQAMGRLRMLESLIGFSTLTVRMSQRGPQNTIPSSNDPFPWVDGLGVEATEWN
jgi:hypothetical protein